jgi:membrane fusion protein (multidrug efflux system)
MVAVETTVLKTRTFQHFLSVQGQVESNQNILVSPQSSGPITRLNVKEGQFVKRGQTLAKIDDDIMQRNVEEVETQLELATILYEKQKRLWDKEIGTEVQYLQAKSNKETMERRLATLREQLDMSVITAPISGVVDKVFPKIGETVAPGQPAFQLVNTSDLSLKAKLSETHSQNVKVGDEVKVSIPIINKDYEARVSVEGQSIDPVSRTFMVEVKLPRDSDIKPNMFGKLSINDQTIEDAVVIPLKVIQKAEKGNYVYVANKVDGQWVAQRRMVKLGFSYEGEGLIEKGLQAGENLITVGYKNLSDGQIINISNLVADVQ